MNPRHLPDRDLDNHLVPGFVILGLTAVAVALGGTILLVIIHN